MHTTSAANSIKPGTRLCRLSTLRRSGWTGSAMRAQFDARRWQQFGSVVLLHNAAPTPSDRRGIALLNCGEHAVLTAFSAAEHYGLNGWERPTTHVLVPGGTRVVRIPGCPVRIHYSGRWNDVGVTTGKRVHRIAPALVVAASTFDAPRSASGILAAGVQQKLVTADELRAVLDAAIRTRHHRLLTLAVEDIGQGAQALSEIDFAILCRRVGLPSPTRQAIRIEPDGRRRYLDAEWTRSDGVRVIVEIDGALHLAPRRWWDDQLRQNELVISGNVVLRYPSVVVRAEPQLVADQLRRVLRL